MTKFKLAFSEDQNELNVTRQGSTFRIDHKGQSFECCLTFQDSATFVLEVIDGNGRRRSIPAAGYATGDNRQLWVDGRVINYQRVRQHRRETTIDGSLSATIPAIVTKILVTPGAAVSAGEKLILLESMKMIIPIQASYDGIVTAVHCQEGESVQAGVQLIEITRKEEL
jgi:biotin carboxyl carrier protein